MQGDNNLSHENNWGIGFSLRHFSNSLPLFGTYGLNMKKQILTEWSAVALGVNPSNDLFFCPMFESRTVFSFNFYHKMTWFFPLLPQNGAQEEKGAKAGVAGLLTDCYGLTRIMMIK
jgi:hypothetical protein